MWVPHQFSQASQMKYSLCTCSVAVQVHIPLLQGNTEHNKNGLVHVHPKMWCTVYIHDHVRLRCAYYHLQHAVTTLVIISNYSCTVSSLTDQLPSEADVIDKQPANYMYHSLDLRTQCSNQLYVNRHTHVWSRRQICQLNHIPCK